jgi:tRNA threonylcarbamoyladenosine biosynthesis protein TsaB
VIVLAIDTCDAVGGVAVLREDEVLSEAIHASQEDYSTWLLPAVNSALKNAGISMKEVDGYAVAAGPGSFTGVRIGLTTVKVWNEVYGKPIAAVSRLQALAEQAQDGAMFVAACADGRRVQVFGAVYHRESGVLRRVSDEMVDEPGKFIATAARFALRERMSWVTNNPDLIVNEEAWKSRAPLGDPLEPVTGTLTFAIGRIGARQINSGQITGALALDARYLRREDAKSAWRDGAKGVL